MNDKNNSDPIDPIDPRPAHVLLREAATLIAQATMKLNNKSTSCTACQSHRYENWVHHNIAVALEAMPEKLERHARDIESGRTEKGQPARKGGG